VLQLRQVSESTRTDGTFQLRDLPVGVYRISYELEGFQPLVREGVRLNLGFVAKLDATLKLGTMKEAITVSGQSPVIDTKSTASAVNFTKETLQNLPTTKSTWQILSMTPGIRVAENDIGGSRLGNQIEYKTYGTKGQNTPVLEGINTRQDTDQAGFYYDYAALEETQVRAMANDAEVALPGANLVAIVKSGGNDFRGSLGYSGQWSGLQSNNITESLRARGVRSSDKQNWYRDGSADLGGPLMRDKLWFYAALRDQRRSFNVLDLACSPGADGQYLTADDTYCSVSSLLTNQTAKFSYQATPKYRFIGFYQRNKKFDPYREGTKFRPLESTVRNTFIPQATKVEFDGTPTRETLVDWLAGYWWYLSAREPQSDSAGNPSRFYRETGLFTGPNSQPTNRPRARWQTTGSVSWFPDHFMGGKHQFKTGYTWYLEKMGREFNAKASGNYMLVYDKVGGVSRQPAEIQTFNYPIHAVANRMRETSVFVKDSWTLTPRLTANIGMRLERYHSYINAQHKEQGQFGTAGDFPPMDVLAWTAVAPRIAFAYDIKGDGKSVAKVSYGRFNHTMGDLFAEAYNLNGLTTTTYRWRDKDGNGDYTPGEVNLDPNNSPDFLSVSGASNNILNKDLKQPYTNEVSFALEHEVMPNFGARFIYVYKQQNRLFQDVNVLRPYSAYSIPLTRKDPGPDGILGNADDGPSVTIYDYDPAFKGSKFVGNKRLNASNPDYYQTYEVTLNKRASQRWEMLTSFGATKNHRQLVLIPQTPNEQYNRIDSTWDWQFKLQGIYNFRRGFRFSTIYQQLSGIPLQRTYTFRAQDPSGGPALKQLSTVAVRLERFGARRTPQQKILNFRVAKEFSILSGKSIEVNAELFNALNTNVPVDMVVDSGPSFGAITSIVPPRIGRLGVLLRF
jgi:hypothetical protein